MTAAQQAVAQSLAADVLEALAAEDRPGLPAADPWHSVPVSQLPPAEPFVGEPAHVATADEDGERLERQMVEQAAALRAAVAEAELLRALVRDTAARFDGLGDSGEAAEVRAERDRAVARALEAEAARAEITFQLDEVMGHLMSLGAGEGALPGESLQTTCARLTGTVRGLLSSRAEAEERRDHAWARSILLEQDLEDARARIKLLERELGEAREHAELALSEAGVLRARLTGSVDGRTAGALRGELLGLRARRDEAELALRSASARSSAVERATGDRVDELSQALARESEKLAEVSSRLAERDAEGLLRSSALARARADLAARDERLQELEAAQNAELERASSARAAAEGLAVERGRLHAESLQTLREVRSALEGLAVALVDATSDESSLGTRTEPGLPAQLERADDERDEPSLR